MTKKTTVRKHKRKGHIREDGTKVKPATVKEHEREVPTKPEIDEGTRQRISMEKAKELFAKRSERSKRMDRLKKAENTLEHATEEWAEQTNMMDVKGIDTPDATYMTQEVKEKEVDKILENRERFFNDDRYNATSYPYAEMDIEEQIARLNGIYDDDKISLLSTPNLFEKSSINKGLQKGDKIEINTVPDTVFQLGDQLFYKFGNDYYLKYRIDKVLDEFDSGELRIQTLADQSYPMVLRDNEFVYALAPKVADQTRGIFWDTDKFEKKMKEIRSKYTKKELGEKMNYTDKQVRNNLKDQLVLHYLWNLRSKP